MWVKIHSQKNYDTVNPNNGSLFIFFGEGFKSNKFGILFWTFGLCWSILFFEVANRSFIFVALLFDETKLKLKGSSEGRLDIS